MAVVAAEHLNLLLIASKKPAGLIASHLQAGSLSEYDLGIREDADLGQSEGEYVDVLLRHLPELDDLEEFKVWRSNQQQLPVVLVTDKQVTPAIADDLAILVDDHVCLAEADAGAHLRRAVRSAGRAWKMHAQFREILAQSPDGVIVANDDSRVLYANPAAVSMFDRSENDFIGSRFRIPVPGDALVEMSIGDDRTAEMRVVSVDWLGEESRLATLRDITDRKKAESALTHAAEHDGLTSLLNRGRFQRDLDKAVDAARDRGFRLALFFIDIDNFKAVNDALGHDVGDEVLRTVAGRLRSVGRSGTLLGRLGGDEFIALAGDVASGDEEAIASRYVHELSKRIDLDGSDLRITCSVGVATFPESADTAHGLMVAADAAMYTAKRGGKNRYCMYSKAAGDAIARRRRLENDIIYAMAKDQMRLEFLPMVSGLGSDASIVMEALLRWDHPLHHDLSPAEFISIAENTGMIEAIGDWVLVEVCSHLSDWRRLPEVNGRLVGVSVNVSATQLMTGKFPIMLERLLKETRLMPNELWIEVQEASLMKNLDDIRGVLHMVRDLGVRVAIDDFGSGYSSMTYLRELPIDALKLNSQFLAGAEDLPQEHDIVRTVLELARSLNLSVVADGLETDKQLQFSRKMGCDMLQGFSITQPLRSEAVEDFITKFGKE